MSDDTIDLREKTCFFTGHRDIPNDQISQIQKTLEAEVIKLIETGVVYYAVGGALGFDTVAALTILKLKSQYPQIKLAIILPCRNYHFSWQGKNLKLYEGLLEQADKVIYTSERYYNGCMYKRNRHMADGSGYCICYKRSDTGGTAYTVDYAHSIGVKIINIV